MQAFAGNVVAMLAYMLFADLATCGGSEDVRHRHATQAHLQAE
eukprot:CAMPEP_0172750118 /NCGR_PEP_ID=MMETSP1074-20121228/148881_1 /TAXON_ID=2916 /ORGANISM="Ceratium fusus, Strain PA161109" /LENGTH=42 /DNA_ID= /DNA_START= /DNA_END= /DNA_ORIENTATION=